MLDEIWLISKQLTGKKLDRQKRKLKKFAKGFLQIEEDIKKDEEMYFKKEEQFRYYLKKVFDPKIGE